MMACALFAASPEAATASDLWCGEHNCYEVLGLLPNATAGEVKKAYFKQSLKWHPDKNPSEEAKNEFAKLAGAYEIISEPRRREVRDRGKGREGNNFLFTILLFIQKDIFIYSFARKWTKPSATQCPKDEVNRVRIARSGRGFDDDVA